MNIWGNRKICIYNKKLKSQLILTYFFKNLLTSFKSLLSSYLAGGVNCSGGLDTYGLFASSLWTFACRTDFLDLTVYMGIDFFPWTAILF